MRDDDDGVLLLEVRGKLLDLGGRDGVERARRLVHQKDLWLHSQRPRDAQPRKHFDAGALQELAESIRQYGVLQPLTVRRLAGGYELVAGERRLRAARLAGLSEVPCLLADVDEESSGMLALVENLQRRDLDYIEEAEGLQKLMQQYHLSQEQAARRIGKSQSAVANKLRILRHPPSVLQALRENHLTERHARALLKLPDEAERLRVIGLIAQGEWTVAKTEQYIDSLLAPRTPQRRELGGFVLRDVRLFLNSIDHQLDLVRAAGVGASRERQETEQEIVLTIRIPKSKASLSRSR